MVNTIKRGSTMITISNIKGGIIEVFDDFPKDGFLHIETNETSNHNHLANVSQLTSSVQCTNGE